MKKLIQFLLLITCCPAWGLKITSDAVDLIDEGDHILMVFHKNAEVFDEKFSLNGDKIMVWSTKSDKVATESDVSVISRVEATSGASFTNKNCRGKGDKIILLPGEQTMILEGGAEIFDETNGTLHGDKLILDGQTKSIRMETPGHQRSTMSIENITLPLWKNKKVEESRKIE